MNAQVKPSLLLPITAAENIKKIRAILAGEEMTGEQLALSLWWDGLKRQQRRALFLLAGINYGDSGKKWLQLPETHRAALALAARAFADKLNAILATLNMVRESARHKLQDEAARVAGKVAA